jgi:signal transduction histidine kinase
MNKTEQNRRRQFIFSFWISFILLLSLNLLLWSYLPQIRRQFRSELQDKLLNINTLIGRIIDKNKISGIIPGEKSSPEYLHYKQLIGELRQESNLQSIRIISPSGEVILSSPESRSADSSDSPLFRKALKGNPQVSDIESYDSQKFISAYTPLFDINGLVTAIIAIEAKAEYFTMLDSLKNRILLLSAINLTAILLIALFLSRMIKRNIRCQRELKEKEHLVRIGTMAATVAHELRNPLAIIEASSSIIKKQYGNNEDEIFSYISDEVRRLNLLIGDFLKLTRTPTLKFEKFNPAALLDRIALSFSEEELQIYSANSEENIEIYSDKNILEQVLLNLIRNAFQSFDNGQSDKKVTVNITAAEENGIMITIADNGRGIKNEDLKNIFTPFFTTRERGTGLGLPISKRLVELLGGTISIKSESGKGTKAVIMLPLRCGDEV